MHLIQFFWTGWFAHLKREGILNDGYCMRVALYFKGEISCTKCKDLIFNLENKLYLKKNCTQYNYVIFLVVVEIFGKKLHPWVILSTSSSWFDLLRSQSPQEPQPISRRTNNQRLRVLVESRMSVLEKKRQKNSSETNCRLSNVIINFSSKKHSYYKSSSSQEWPIIATMVRRG